MTTSERKHNESADRHAGHPGTQETATKTYAVRKIGERAEFYVPSTDAAVCTHGSPLWIDKIQLDEALAASSVPALPRAAVVEFMFLVGLGWPTSVAAEVNGIGPSSSEMLLNPEYFAVCVDVEDEGLRGIGQIGDPAYWTAVELFHRRRARAVDAHGITQMGRPSAADSYALLPECLLRGRSIAHSILMLRASGEIESSRDASSRHRLMTSLLVLGLQIEPFLRDDSNRMIPPSLTATLLEEEIGMSLRASLATCGLADRSSCFDSVRLREAQKVFRAADQYTKPPTDGVSWEKQVLHYEAFCAHAGRDQTWREFLDFFNSISIMTERSASAPHRKTSTLEKHLRYRTVDKATVSSSTLPAETLLEHMRQTFEPPEDIASVAAAISVLAAHSVTSIGAIANLTCEDVLRLGVEDEMAVSLLMHATYECLTQPWLVPEPPRAVIAVNEDTIDCLSLDVRSRNCLMRAKVTTVARLLELNDDELLALPNFGVKSLARVREALKAHQTLATGAAAPR